MAGFFKKALGAFVQVPEDEEEDLPTPQDLDEEARRLLADIEGAQATPPQGAAYAAQAQQAQRTARPSEATAPDAPATGASFEGIYGQAQVQASPYSAEMLLRVAEGLKALPLAQARAAVDAMDAADDRWTVGDVLLDAERKIEALRAVEHAMEAQRQGAEDQYQRAVSAIDEQMASAEAQIQAQIAELQGLLQEARETATVERARALSDLEATRAAAGTEVARLQAEVTRLQQVHEFLGEPQG